MPALKNKAVCCVCTHGVKRTLEPHLFNVWFIEHNDDACISEKDEHDDDPGPHRKKGSN